MNADTQIGMRKYVRPPLSRSLLLSLSLAPPDVVLLLLAQQVLPCMSTSGCSAKFLEHEYPVFLSRKSIAALHRIKQEKEVDEAALEGLEKCPCVAPFPSLSVDLRSHLVFEQEG